MKKKQLITLILIILYSIGKAQEKTYTITVYNALPSQCNEDNLITADGSKIDTIKLENGSLKWVAVSRDMLNDGFKYGDKIKIISNDPEINGIYEIHDTMNKRYYCCVDILMPKRIKLGKWTNVSVEKIER